eukprot:gene29068-38122_t
MQQQSLYKRLDEYVREKRLTDLHTHLMGMGSANFWRLAFYQHQTDLLKELLTLLDLDAKSTNPGNLMSIIRNSFEFLSKAGTDPTSFDCHSYRGEFHPSFYPARFELKDRILDVHPEVAGILLNTTNREYEKAGVNYIEYSVSSGDIIDFQSSEKDGKFAAMLTKVYESQTSVTKTRPTKGRASGANSRNNSLSSMDEVVNGSEIQTASIVAPNQFLCRNKNSSTKSSTGAVSIFEPTRGSDEVATSISSYNRGLESSTLVSISAPLIPNNTGMSTLPALRKCNYKLKWRSFVEYNEKPNGQIFKFLAAFNREKITHSEIWPWGEDFKRDHLKAFHKLAMNEFKAISFLEGLRNRDGAAELRDELNQAFEGNILTEKLHVIAKWFCSDDAVSLLYPGHIEKCSKLREKLLENDGQLLHYVVGLDWVGDELGHPFCAFNHSSFIDLVRTCRGYNPKFGVRIHAGEGIIRPASFEGNLDASECYQAFCLHLFILMETIKKIDSKLGSTIRIGHGIGFLFGSENEFDDAGNLTNNNTEIVLSESVKYLLRELHLFRKNYLRIDGGGRGIVCELCPTSNNMLLSSSFNDHNHNTPTLKTFLKLGLAVTLCTDDDGVWRIKKCATHNHHVSVAAEYCQAIKNGHIQRTEELDQLISRSRRAAFIGQNEMEVEDE